MGGSRPAPAPAPVVTPAPVVAAQVAEAPSVALQRRRKAEKREIVTGTGVEEGTPATKTLLGE